MLARLCLLLLLRVPSFIRNAETELSTIAAVLRAACQEITSHSSLSLISNLPAIAMALVMAAAAWGQAQWTLWVMSITWHPELEALFQEALQRIVQGEDSMPRWDALVGMGLGTLAPLRTRNAFA